MLHNQEGQARFTDKMKTIFFLLPLLIFGLIPSVFGEIEQGINYDKQVLQTFPDGSQKIKWTQTPERIFYNNSYHDFLFTDNPNSLQIETAHGSILLDKSSCGFSFYNKGLISGNPLFIDSIVAKMANVGSNSWSLVNSINNATCEAYYDQGNNSLVAKRYAFGVGFIEYKYINQPNSWKTQLEATNLSSQTDKKFGFTQTIDLNRDSIEWDGQQKNLDNFSNVTFDRIWLESHESKVLDFLNDFYFNLGVAFPFLDSVYVFDSGINKTKLSFNFMLNDTPLLPFDTLIIDPTFSSNNPTVDGQMRDSGNNGFLDGDAFSKQDAITSVYVGRYELADPYDGSRGFFEYDISSIPSSIFVTSAIFTFETGADLGTRNGCEFRTMSSQPSTATDDQIWHAIGNGTIVSTSCPTASSTNQSITLDSDMYDYIESQLSADWVSIGVKSDTEGLQDATFHTIQIYSEEYAGTPDPTLEIIYTTVANPDPVTDLSNTSLTQTTAGLSWTLPALNGGNLFLNYMINYTTPYGSATTFYANTTSTTATVTGLTLGTPYSFQVSVFTGNNTFNWGGNILNVTTLTYIPPSAPTLSALSESETSVRFTSINGTTGDFNMFYYGLRCLENGLAPWVTIVSNSTTPDPRVYSYTLSPGDNVTCQWRDGSLTGFGDWSNNATETTGSIGIIQAPRGDHDDKLMDFATWIEDEGGLYFGMGVFPMLIMLIGFMATKATVRIFTLISLMAMGIIHASGYFEYPAWYWTLAILFGLVLVLGRQARD